MSIPTMPLACRVRTFLPTALVLILSGCAAALTPGQRAREAAQEYATAIRFGRFELAAERMSEHGRTELTVQHAGWGATIRILECEPLSLGLKGRAEANVVINVAWQRVDESELHVTQVGQRWQDHRGTWLLESEERRGGDVGLLGEPVVVVRPQGSAARYESISIP